MNNDFITLACPSCGGKLEISSNTTSLKCPSCGNEHIVRRDATNIFLESFARCPMCGRNDEVRKVTAIVANQTQNLQGVTIEKHSYTDKDGYRHTSTEKVPFTGTQASILALKLQAPSQPNATNKPGCAWGLRYVVLFYAIAGFFSIFSVFQKDEPGVPTFLFVPLGLVFGILGTIWFVSLNRKYHKLIDQYNNDLINVNKIEVPKWKGAVKRWNKTYYCFRDDCVFIPGESESFDPDSLSKLLYK